MHREAIRNVPSRGGFSSVQSRGAEMDHKYEQAQKTWLTSACPVTYQTKSISQSPATRELQDRILFPLLTLGISCEHALANHAQGN
mmetsp:Transcript_14355/g.30988  ORF Transcript_14355/g.30988 Transcript_14355/m.30988 type:complete len:86 (-) Transcript_14355:181-438(-)